MVRASLLLVLPALMLAACGGGDRLDTALGTPGARFSIHEPARQCWTLQASDGRYLRATDSGFRADADAASDAQGFFFQPARLGSYLLLAEYQRAFSPITENARSSGDEGTMRLLGVSDPLGNLLDALGHLVVEVGYLVSGVGDIAGLALDVTPISGDPVRELGENVGDLGDTLGNTAVRPRVAAVGAPSDISVWNLVESGDGRVHLVNDASGQHLAAVDGELGLTAANSGLDTRWKLAATEGCDEYPEASLNARVLDPAGPKRFWNDRGGDVYGWVDAHAHITAYEFIGGRVNYGKTHHPFGVMHALGDCAIHHGPQGLLGTVEMLTSNAFTGHETAGWPSYNHWPRSDSLQHHQTYYRWIERAFLAGQKVLVNLITHNEVLCQIVPQKQNSCDIMDNVRLQVQRTRELQDYIDAQHGGPGKGWFRIVTSPGEARQVIADGKMAVVIGVEDSKPLNCGEFLDIAECAVDEISTRLDEWHDLGVRIVFPVHKFDNAFGGHLPHSGFAIGTVLTAGNLLETGHLLEMENCPLDENGEEDFGSDPNDPRRQPEGLFEYLIANVEYLLKQLPAPLVDPFFPETGTDPSNLCNIRGLKAPHGHVLLDELMKRRMMIDVDHMSRRAATEALDYLQPRGYPAISSHDWTGSQVLLNRIAREQGFIARFARGGRDEWVERLHGMAKRYRGAEFFGGGIASDVNGIANLPQDPRIGATDSESQLSYPFRSYDGRVEFDEQITGDRVFNLYDGRGVAHYGLYADYIADTQQFGGEGSREALNVFFRSAEAWLRHWERTEAAGG